jgi:hypothetical protein
MKYFIPKYHLYVKTPHARARSMLGVAPRMIAYFTQYRDRPYSNSERREDREGALRYSWRYQRKKGCKKRIHT